MLQAHRKSNEVFLLHFFFVYITDQFFLSRFFLGVKNVVGAWRTGGSLHELLIIFNWSSIAFFSKDGVAMFNKSKLCCQSIPKRNKLSR